VVDKMVTRLGWETEMARRAYILARDAREPATRLWNIYARMLHRYRMEVRKKSGA
jgi:hypothetical protein